MYKNVQTPHSPLSPLPPRIQISEYISEKTQNYQCLTPSCQSEKTVARRNTRRSFTPSAFDTAAPPSVSPIQTVFESPESDSENSAILLKSVSSATKLAELMSIDNSPLAELHGIVDRKSQSASVHKTRRYHCQRKFENRPSNMNIDITSLRRSLNEQFMSPSMPPVNRKVFTPSSGSPRAVFNPMYITVKRGSKPMPTQLVNKYTPLKDTFHAQNVDKTNTSHSNLNNDSILNTNFRIESVLKEIGLEKYIEKFQMEEIDLFVFFHLVPEDLIELNIAEEDHETMLQAIKTYAN